MMLLLMMIGTTIFSQNLENKKCFSQKAIDSIYYSDRYCEYIKKENEVLKEALKYSEQINSEKEKQISLYKQNESNYQLIDSNYKDMQENLYEIIENKDFLLKEQKKKKWIYLGKGIVIGGAVTGTLLLIFN